MKTNPLTKEEVLRIVRKEVKRIVSCTLNQMTNKQESAIGFRYTPEHNDPDEYWGKKEN